MESSRDLEPRDVQLFYEVRSQLVPGGAWVWIVRTLDPKHAQAVYDRACLLSHEVVLIRWAVDSFTFHRS